MLVEPEPMNLRVRRFWRFFIPARPLRTRSASPILVAQSMTPTSGGQMGLLDRLLGRGKKAAGDLAGDASLQHEGAAQERQGAARDSATRPQRPGQSEKTPS